ncbi:hypothetical protein B0H17DRAFT_838835, partial [Mycena rosella]
MAENLPEEITKEILTLVFEPNPDLYNFFNLKISMTSTFRPKPMACVTVSKTWNRIRTPLLYCTVILKSKVQAEALATALGRREELGPCIKNLMVRGGYGRSMKTILASMANLQTIWLTLSFASKESITGLLSGLHLVNPRELI